MAKEGDAKYIPFDFPLNGKLNTSEDPLKLQKNDFQQLTNLRYTDTGIEGVSGMTKINSAAIATYTKILGGFHFEKDYPAYESNILVNATNPTPVGSTYTYEVLQNTGTNPVPGADSFSTSIFSAPPTSTEPTHSFSNAPDSSVAFCNGIKNYIWHGDEFRVSKVLAEHLAYGDMLYDDPTAELSNSVNDENNKYLMVVNEELSGISTTGTRLLLHFDGNLTDSSLQTPHTVTNVGCVYDNDVTAPVSTKKFGTRSLFTTGSSYLTVPRNVDFDFSLGIFTIDAWVYVYNDEPAYTYLYSHETDDNNKMVMWTQANHPSSHYAKVFAKVIKNGTTLTLEGGSFRYRSWHHLAWVGDGTYYRLFVDGELRTVTAIGTTLPQYYTGDIVLCRSEKHDEDTNCKTFVDELRVSNYAVWSSRFSPATTAYVAELSVEGRKTGIFSSIIYVGSTVPIYGVKFYVATANTGGVLYAFYWDGGGWVDVVSPVDNTVTAGVSLAKTGTMTWADTETTAQPAVPRFFYDTYLYFYKFVLSGAPSPVSASESPSVSPSTSPSVSPSASPSESPSVSPSGSPSASPSGSPSLSASASISPSASPSQSPSAGVSESPSESPSISPSPSPSISPSPSPSLSPSASVSPSMSPSGSPSISPSPSPSASPSVSPSTSPSPSPSLGMSGEVGVCELYQITLLAYAQEISDLWDGTYRKIMDVRDNVLDDYTINLAQDVIDTTDTMTFIDLNDVAAGQYYYFGFLERISVLSFGIYGVGNTEIGTMKVECWDGGKWYEMAIVDETQQQGVTLARTGTVNIYSSVKEQKRSYKEGTPYYYYRVSFSVQLVGSADHIYFYYISGASHPVELGAYQFPVLWQNRLMLCGNSTQHPNRALGSVPNTNCVFNGTGVANLYIGDGSLLLAGETLFSRFGGTLYDNLVLFKRDATYLVDGYDQSTYKVYTIADDVGITAPATLKKCDTSFEVIPGLQKHVLIWQSSRGVMMFDGNTINCISGDIDSYFDQDATTHIEETYAHLSKAFYDPKNNEYHLLCITGAATTINTELVYDLSLKKWFTIDRGTGNYLQCGFQVNNTHGLSYCYGGITSYILRLEFGTTFNGTGITYTFHTGDVNFSGSMMFDTELRYLKLTALAMTTSTATVAMTVYPDTSSTGQALPVISQTRAGYRNYMTNRSFSIKAITHSIKAVVTTTNENCGFHPHMLSGLCRVIRHDIL